jgi:hypothetical protein
MKANKFNSPYKPIGEVAKYVHNKTMQLNTKFIIINGLGFYDTGNEIIEKERFEQKYEMKTILNQDQENPDKRKLWMS